MSPFFSSTMPTNLRSNSSTRFGELPSTTRADDGVAELNLPALNPAIDDLQGRHDKAGRGQNLCRSNSRSLQFLVENKSDLRFDLRLDSFADPENRRVLQHHVIEDMTEAGLIAVKHLLHRLAGETDFFSHHFGAVGFL